MHQTGVKLRAGKYRVPVTLVYDNEGRIIIRFKYNKKLVDEIRNMEGRKWHGRDDPTKKYWSIPDSQRNAFQLSYLQGLNPYAHYDAEIIQHDFKRPLYEHQKEFANFMLAMRQVIIAGEMGCIDGDATVHCSRAGRGFEITISELFYKFHGKLGQKHWDSSVSTMVRSLCDGVLRLNEVNNVIYQGVKPTVKLILKSGKSLILTPDHEVCIGVNEYQSVETLNIGDTVLSNGAEVQYLPVEDKIISIEPGQKVEVYDLVMADPYRNFVANNIVVKNCGKTLSAIECMERSNIPGNEWWYVAPKSGLKAVQRELRIWKSMVYPKMMTYEGLTKAMKEWPEGQKAPGGLFLDESARVKNPTAQRSQAAKILADGIRNDWGKDGYIILMSGAPAPKSPADWWHQCEIACPGYLKEGDLMKFKKRLAIIVQKESERAGGVYPHLESWLDDEKKCQTCGQYQDNVIHSVTAESLILGAEGQHKFKSSVNEVSYLYERMKGLVLVKFKKDCLDLPDKRYRIIKLTPSQKTLNMAKSVLGKATTVISGITLMRELSDGFQYRNKESGVEICPVCAGHGKIKDPLNNDELVDCVGCGGKGNRKKYKRIAEQITCPKEDALRDLLDELTDVGRIVIYAGFTGSVDRCVQICQACGWQTVRVDGRGWNCRLQGDPLDIFQDQLVKYPRVAFVGQPGAAGVGLTLTASPMIVYYSNDYNFENRVQSEARIHRPGMDLNRGATIVDLVHLPTDQLVLDNLQKKKRLQALTMGELKGAL